MNNLHKSLIIGFLAVSFFISGLPVDLVSAQNTAAGPASAQRPVDLLQSKYLRFGRLTSEDGLSNDQVRGVAQDRHGFIWIATLNGLNRYDGTDFKVYRHDPNNPHSLSNNLARDLIVDRSGTPWIGTWGGGLNQYDREKDAFIHYQHDPDDPRSLNNNITRTIFEDRAGAIWVGTMGGLNKLDRESGTFTRYLHDPENPNSLSNNIVLSVIEDRTGVFWVGTEGGLDRFDPETEQFTHYRNDPDDPTSLSHNVVRVIYEDHTGDLWLATNKGLCKFIPETNGFTRYQHDPDNPLSLNSNYVTWVFEDRAGRLWVGTWGGGLNRFDRETATFTHYYHYPSDRYSLSNNNVDSIAEDRHGMIWIATDGGVNSIDGKAKPFYHYRIIADNPNGIGNNAVRSIHAGHSGSIWIGTNGGGFFRFDRQTEQFTGYQNDPADPNSLSDDAAVAIYEDRMGLIWVGTSGHGLNRFDPDAKRFTHYRYNPSNPRSLSSDIINFIYEDRAGTLWFGTSGGLNAFDRETEQFTRYRHDPADPLTLSNDYVTCITEDHESILWVSTFGGLNRFDRETRTFTRYYHLSSDPQSLAQDGVASIYEDRTGTLWVGTAAGLDKFDRTNGKFTHYTTANGLPSNTIWGILEDEQGRLWISTSSKMSRFDPRTETFRTFDVSDGLQSSTFYRWSAYSKSPSSEMFFGGPNGFNAFYPDQIVDDMTPPPVLISGFQLANKPVPIGADSVLKKSILETDEMVLSYKDRVLSFEIAVLNYQAPEKNRFRYIMEGFEKEWNEVDRTRRIVTYTNLDPGAYVFSAIGSNNDGIWNEEGDSVRIIVLPPWWKTMWFRISIVVAAIGLLAGGFRWRVGAIETKRRELEIQVQTMTRAKQMQAERDRILEVSQDLICIAGMDGYFKYLNPAWETNFGFTIDELRSRKFLDFVHPDDREKTERELEALAAGRQTADFENRYTHRDGSFRHLSWKATPLPDEERVYAVGRDITERKQIERKYRTVADFTYDWEYWANLDGTLEYMSPSCERISGYSVQDFMENPSLLRDIVVPEDRGVWDQHVHDSIDDLTLKETHFRIKYKDGDIRWIEHACRPVIDHQGNLDGIRASNRDITARKQIEISLQASQEKAAALASNLITTQEAGSARLARELHDDINQRLAFLKIEVDKLHIKNPSLPEPAADKLRQIARDIGVLSSDINLISRRLHPIALEILGLIRSIEAECQNFTRLNEIPVTLDLDGTLQYLSKEISLGAYRILQESLRNIVRHAKATDVHVTLSKNNGILHLVIIDNGIGFVSASNGVKVGLGIASMTERARLLQGNLSIESRPGKGTAIKLAVPLESRKEA